MPKALVVNKENVVPKETYYLLIVDASSSMSPLTKSTISGVNEQIDSIKQLEKEFPEQKYNMSFMHFNNTVTIEYTDRKSSSLEHISETNYKCSGMTALLDAIGVGVRNLNEKIGDKIASGEAAAVVVIITDGAENASREFDGSKVKSMIEELQATNRWTFTFVGANIDSISTASRYGIDVKNVMQFSGDELSNKKVYASMTKSFKSRAMAMDLGISYQADTFLSDEDKDVTSK
jgi:Mg-chelatase subunit ChlD